MEQTGFGDCSRCPARQTYCVKRGKERLCLACAKHDSAKLYIQRAATKKTVRRRGAMIIEAPELPTIGNFEKMPTIGNLREWYAMVAMVIAANPCCENCGKFIPQAFYGEASAHIIAKRFASVQLHPFNFLILGPNCGCHNKFDSSVETASQMPVWPKAVERWMIFRHLITEIHKQLDLFEHYALKIYD